MSTRCPQAFSLKKPVRGNNNIIGRLTGDEIDFKIDLRRYKTRQIGNRTVGLPLFNFQVCYLLLKSIMGQLDSRAIAPIFIRNRNLCAIGLPHRNAVHSGAIAKKTHQEDAR